MRSQNGEASGLVPEVLHDRELYPPNLWLDDQPIDHETYAEEVTQKRIDAMVEDDIWVPPYWERED